MLLVSYCAGKGDSIIIAVYLRSNTMSVQHKSDCNRVFKRYDLSCPRCKELAQGAAPKPGYSDFRKRQEKVQLDAIRNHDCRKSNCGPVCTFGEW